MKAVLEEMLARVPGALGAAVVGLDGIPVEVMTTGRDVNMEVVSAEGIGLVRSSGWAPSASDADVPEEIAVRGRSRLTILRALGSGYFLFLVAEPHTLSGQARYEVWRTGLKLRQVLG
jgi:predicted regulator of Ras-like GTPase activity (Roadblock/LC7/MglB family)